MKPKFVCLIGAVILAIGAAGALPATLPASGETVATSSTPWTDDFSSTSLESRWSWIREDPTRWSLSARPGFLRLTTQRNFSNINNLLVQNMPVGDYELETRVLFAPSENYQIAGLLVYQDDSNFLTLGRAFCDTPPPQCVNNGIYFDRIEGGVFSNYAMTIPVSGEAYLKLIRQGKVYTGYVSTDGINWTMVGAHTVTITPTKIGLKASNQIQGTTEISADFDFFTLIDHSERLFLPLILR